MSRKSENGYSFTDTIRAMSKNQYFSFGEDTMSKRVQASIAAKKTGASLATRVINGELRVYCEKPATNKVSPIKLYKLISCKEVPNRSGGGRPPGSLNAAKPSKKNVPAKKKSALTKTNKKPSKTPAKKAPAKAVKKPTVKNIKTHAAKLTPAK